MEIARLCGSRRRRTQRCSVVASFSRRRIPVNDWRQRRRLGLSWLGDRGRGLRPVGKRRPRLGRTEICSAASRLERHCRSCKCGQLSGSRDLRDGLQARIARTAGAAASFTPRARIARSFGAAASTPTPTGGHLRRLLLSVASGLTCGRERPQKVLLFLKKDARRCAYFSVIYVELLGVPTEPGARFA